jgi:hypothetical protein
MLKREIGDKIRSQELNYYTLEYYTNIARQPRLVGIIFSRANNFEYFNGDVQYVLSYLKNVTNIFRDRNNPEKQSPV